MKQTSETAFETAIEAVLLRDGYRKLASDGFESGRSIFPAEAFDFIRETQAPVWEYLEAMHGAETGERVLQSYCKWLDICGALTTLRHGFKCFGNTLRIAFFRTPTNSIPISKCGIEPIDSASPGSCTSALNTGIRLTWLFRPTPSTSTRHDREQHEPIFLFTRHTLEHFAVDTEDAWMSTRLADGESDGHGLKCRRSRP